MTSEFSVDATPDILFLIGCWPGESKRYRVYNLADALKARGYDCLVYDFERLRDIMAFGIVPRVVVFFRAPYNPAAGIVEFLDYTRQHCITTIYDIDDYVFELGALPFVSGIKHYDAKERHGYEWGVRAYRSLMFCCDKSTTSTEYLGEKMRLLGRDASIVVNTINREQYELAHRICAQERDRHDRTIRIGYYSGSATHKEDFQQCADALKAVMDKHPNVVFRLVGLLDLDESWLRFADRIERAGFMSPLAMLEDLATCDINIAPLEEGNPFCEGKSELKWFEAAIVKVPTIASKTCTYEAAIEHGVSGYLASDQPEWEAAFEHLISSAKHRREVGDQARSIAIKRHGQDVGGRQALAAYGLETFEDTEPRMTKHKLRIGWLLPGLIIGGGGHRNILRAAYHLENFGYDVRLYITDTDSSSALLRQQVRRHFYPFKGPVVRFEGQVDEEEVLFATHWSTVAHAEAARPTNAEIIYFVQDFEPAFYSMGSEYLLAEDTYRKGLYAICSGPWCAALLKKNYHAQADYFVFPIDRETYFVKPQVEREPKIVFFAKPEMPRRCFTLGVEALRHVSQMRPEIEIVFFGSNAAACKSVDYKVSHIGVLPTIADLADLYCSSTLGIVFSTTNPSLVPFEMMACGLPVIDLGLPGNEVNFDDRYDIALLVDPNPQRMAAEILALYDDEVDRHARSLAGIDFASRMPTEEEMAARVKTLLLSRIGAHEDSQQGRLAPPTIPAHLELN